MVLGKKAAMEFEVLVKIVIVLAVLMVVLLFFRYGFAESGEGVGEISGTVIGGKSSATSRITDTFSDIFSQWGGCEFEITDPAPATCAIEISKGDCSEAVSTLAPSGSAIKCGCKATRSDDTGSCEISIEQA